MGTVNISDLKPGMVLEDDVITSKGTKLLPKGTELTERHLQIMNTWGVVEACVEGITREDIAQGKIEEISEEDRAKIQAEVDGLFSGFYEDEVMSEIARVVTKIKIERLQAMKAMDTARG